MFVFQNTSSTYADEGGGWCERGDSSDRDGDNGNSELHFDLFVVVKKDEEGDCETHLSFLSPKASRYTMPTSGNPRIIAKRMRLLTGSRNVANLNYKPLLTVRLRSLTNRVVGGKKEK